MEHTIRPKGHRILVKMKPYDPVTKNGIMVVTGLSRDTHTKALQHAIVMELGATAYSGFGDGTPWCKVGDLVLITKYAGVDIKDDESEDIYRVINDDDVLAVLESKEGS